MLKQQTERTQLVKLLQGGESFRPLSELLEGIDYAQAGTKPHNLPYSLWQLLEHMRITQHDILEFSRNPTYTSPEWPDGYWPEHESPADEEALTKTIASIKSDLNAMISLVQDEQRDLYEPFAHGSGQNLFREALVLAQHNAYHLGELLVLRRLLGNWE